MTDTAAGAGRARRTRSSTTARAGLTKPPSALFTTLTHNTASTASMMHTLPTRAMRARPPARNRLHIQASPSPSRSPRDPSLHLPTAACPATKWLRATRSANRVRWMAPSEATQSARRPPSPPQTRRPASSTRRSSSLEILHATHSPATIPRSSRRHVTLLSLLQHFSFRPLFLCILCYLYFSYLSSCCPLYFSPVFIN